MILISQNANKKTIVYLKSSTGTLFDKNHQKATKEQHNFHKDLDPLDGWQVLGCLSKISTLKQGIFSFKLNYNKNRADCYKYITYLALLNVHAPSSSPMTTTGVMK